MKWKSLATPAAVVLVSLVLFAYFFGFGPDTVVYRKEIQEGNVAIAQIEVFRSQRHRLPSSMEEAGITVPDPQRIYYERCSDTQYLVWFGTTLGESMTYDSATSTWLSLNIGCEDAR